MKTISSPPQPVQFAFAGFVLDPGTRTLARAGEPLPLTPKEFHALLLLAEAGGQAVARETLIQAIWPDTIVGDTSLGRIVSVLRRHLGAEAIVSISRFGYRLVPAVTLVEPAAPAAIPAISPARRWPFAAAAVLVVAIAGLFAVRHFTRRPPPAATVAAAARWDALGLFALREGTYFRASKAFQQAIQLDPRNPLLHAHLADAWLQLNMDQAARQELLLAANQAQLAQLPDSAQQYIEAVRATAVRDYPAATRQYQALLEAAAPDDEATALEDLGRALQREHRLPEAVAAYRHAAELQPTNAGVQLHLGILAGLERKQPAAVAYLDRATQLYDASTNQEGKAEVSYQRASMAYVRADYKAADAFYSDSLDGAVKLNDLQMQARALGGLSTVRRWDGDLAGSADAARRENALGDRLNSDFWQAEAAMHLANIALARKDVPQARTLLTQALELARRIQQPRIQANAEFSIADLADQTGDFAQELSFAQLSREHYASYGSADGVADASLQIVQAERGLRNYPAALRDANALLENSIRTGSDLFAEDTEAELGHIYSALEDHAAALDHYQRSLVLARKTGSQVPLKTLHVVCALTRLGRLQEARKLFATVPVATQKDPDCQKRYLEALAMLQHPSPRKKDG